MLPLHSLSEDIEWVGHHLAQRTQPAEQKIDIPLFVAFGIVNFDFLLEFCEDEEGRAVVNEDSGH